MKTFLQWRRDIKENGTVLCLPTTAGLWQGLPVHRNTSNRQNENGNENEGGGGRIMFVLNNELA